MTLILSVAAMAAGVWMALRLFTGTQNGHRKDVWFK